MYAPKTGDRPSAGHSPATFSSSGEEALRERWWLALKDADLAAAVDRALESNFDLATAWQRLREAQAIADRTSSALYPDLQAQAGAEWNGGGRNEDSHTLFLGLASEYEVDLWGRISSAAEADRRTSERRPGGLSNRSPDALGGSRPDLVSIDGIPEQLSATEAQVAVLENRLAVRPVGHPRGKGILRQESCLPCPPLPETGLPADLVRRRPDVQRAYLQLQAADQDLAAAVSNRYPRLSLSASISTAERDAVNLFDRWTRTLAGNLVAPLFDAGGRRAEVDRNEAIKQQFLFEMGRQDVARRDYEIIDDTMLSKMKGSSSGSLS